MYHVQYRPNADHPLENVLCELSKTIVLMFFFIGLFNKINSKKIQLEANYY